MEQVEGKTRRWTPKRRSTADEYPKEDLRDASEPSVDAASSEMRSGGYQEAILKELKDGGTADVCQITQDLD